MVNIPILTFGNFVDNINIDTLVGLIRVFELMGIAVSETTEIVLADALAPKTKRADMTLKKKCQKFFLHYKKFSFIKYLSILSKKPLLSNSEKLHVIKYNNNC